MHRVGIALGSNLGNRTGHLQAARDLLLEISESPLLQAAIYRTEPVSCPENSPDFYNSVVEITFSGSPFELLKLTQTIEKNLGRASQAIRNAPRVIDVDLLYFGDQVVESGPLVLPHPRLAQRRFVLQPLAEIRPELVLPGQQVSVSDLLRSLVSEEPLLEKVTPNW
ncbi:MAG: 2-amino-4-hydroxy-6-hydroxymethyldihydropteridine diphosphokinase [Luteolibacter sp.]